MSSVQVPGRDSFWYNFDRRYYSVHPELHPADAGIWELPHWMTWLGGVLKAEGYTEISALTLYTAVDISKGIDTARIRRDLDLHPADVYLYSPMTPNLHFALEIAALLKQIYPKSYNVFGGVVATPLHVDIARHPAIDFVVRDRGEVALPQLLRALETGAALTEVKNLTYTVPENGSIRAHPELYPALHPEAIPFPHVDLFPAEVGRSLRYIRQNYGLGCPFKCSFCTIQTIGRKTNYFPIARVLAEIDAYRAHYGEHHNIYFGDETFTLNTQRTIAFCNALQARGDITYDIQTRLMSLGDDSVLRALRDSGCRWVEVGIESLIQDSLSVHKQNSKVSVIRDTLKRLQDHELPVCSFIVNGLPEQTPYQMELSTDLVCELLDEQLLHATYFFGLVPYPGSSLFEAPATYGMTIRHRDYSLYNEDLEPVYDTNLATAPEIYAAFLSGVRKLSDAMSGEPLLGETLSPTVLASLGSSLTHV